jgi:hypothetical protein
MPDLLFSVSKVEVSDDGVTWTDLGVTKGGARLTQDPENLEITSDQNADPEAVIPIRAVKTISLNLLDAKPENIALAFGGTVNGSAVEIPAVLSGVEKQVRITTKPINGVNFTIEVPRASITGRSEINLTNDDAAVLPLEIRVLTPQSGPAVTITKVTA